MRWWWWWFIAAAVVLHAAGIGSRADFFNVVLSLRLTDTITPEEEPRHDSCMSVFPRHFEAVLPTAFDIYTPTADA